jgi:hypothetical protein
MHQNKNTKRDALYVIGPTKRAVIGDRPDLNRAWEEEKPIRLLESCASLVNETLTHFPVAAALPQARGSAGYQREFGAVPAGTGTLAADTVAST